MMMMGGGEGGESELQKAIRLRQEKLHMNDLKKKDTNAWDDD